jgi:hypothetical protein
MAYRSSMEYGPTADDGLPTHVYYNAQIINNRTDDFDNAGNAYPNPPIRFNETRDAALIKDASKYAYSIVRFTMNGPNLNLPLWIPNIETGQSDPNKTTYKLAITYQQTWNVVLGGVLQAVEFEISPTATTVIFVPEYKNQIIAPTPQPPTIVQDVNTPYYFIYSYSNALEMFNTALKTALQAAYNSFNATWLSAAAANGKPAGSISTAFPYTGFDTGATPFWSAVNPPKMSYDPGSGLFTFNLDSNAFGPRIATFFTSATEGAPVTPPKCRIFMNNNTYGLFSNFPTSYWNRTAIDDLVYPVPEGYVWELLVRGFPMTPVRDQGVNTAPQGANAGAGYVPNSRQLGYTNALGVNALGPPNQVKQIYLVTQDWKSTDSLWSPIGSIVFTSTLLPVRSEATGTPVILGTSNIGNSAATSQSAFQPIVTDIALDMGVDGADAYRRFIFYSPSAEYRMCDLANSNIDIRSIDIQVFFKNRLNNNLYPVTMFNLSSVDFKMMFRHKRVY